MAGDRLRVERLDGAAIVRLKGQAEYDLAQELHRTLDEVLESGYVNVIIDMKDAGLISSTIVGIILAYAGRFRHREGELKICRASGPAQQVLGLLGVDKFVAVFDDRAGALGMSADEARSRLGIHAASQKAGAKGRRAPSKTRRRSSGKALREKRSGRS